MTYGVLRKTYFVTLSFGDKTKILRTVVLSIIGASRSSHRVGSLLNHVEYTLDCQVVLSIGMADCESSPWVSELSSLQQTVIPYKRRAADQSQKYLW